ncbi:MAG: alkaline phosphatase family protein [Clostridia bacterium]|nr:hypothetical protein [Oscillospiraceae bacterium]MBQ7034068.1 alkaline phosphatase family protein [Clostridia bacterium]
MKNKVILISIDGMRPDGLEKCGHPFVEELKKMGASALDAQTVFPSVTLPCHMSMFHSVPPQRHGTTTNIYMPQVRPIKGLFEQIHAAGGKCGMFYGWEPLRDISRPGSLRAAEYLHSYDKENTDGILTDKMFACAESTDLDFIFLYMVETDEKGGHDNGWMTEAYLERLYAAMDNVQRVIEELGSLYTVIVTSDHGGHDRSHGTDMPEDMTIPMFFVGKEFTPGSVLKGVSILDLAPTIARILDVPPAEEWEGKPLAGIR